MNEKVHELSKREQKIVQYEVDLRHKMEDVSKTVISKEEEIISIKKKFMEEKKNLEIEKKKLSNALEDSK